MNLDEMNECFFLRFRLFCKRLSFLRTSDLIKTAYCRTDSKKYYYSKEMLLNSLQQ